MFRLYYSPKGVSLCMVFLLSNVSDSFSQPFPLFGKSPASLPVGANFCPRFHQDRCAQIAHWKAKMELSNVIKTMPLCTHSPPRSHYLPTEKSPTQRMWSPNCSHVIVKAAQLCNTVYVYYEPRN